MSLCHDILITSDDISKQNSLFEDNCTSTFPYLCPLIYFLKLEASHSESSIFVDQHKYAQDLVGLVEVRDFATFDTPMELNVKLFFDDGDLFDDPTHFQTIVGSLNYLTITRHDISLIN